MSAARRLVIYHTSDVHDRRGFGTLLGAVVEPGSLLVDCGDALRGSSTVYHRDEGVMEEFARAPYRAQAVGNREFHYLHSRMLARSRASQVPWVCSNLVDLRDRPPAFVRALVVEVAGLRVRLLALLAPQYRTGSGWERIFGWRFLATGVALDEMRADASDDVDATLLLSHLGLAADRAIAEKHPELTAVIGGHSHDMLAHPDVVGGVPIVHAGAYARWAGRLELSLDGPHASVVSYELIPLLDRNGAR